MEAFYSGKAKNLYKGPQEDQIIIEFKDDLTAMNAQKKGSFLGKGQVNSEISYLIFQELQRKKIKTHLLERKNDIQWLCEKVEIIPLEVVVRNRIAGSLAKKMGLEEGRALPQPLVEFYFKSDELQDPFLSDSQIEALEIEDLAVLEELKAKANAINDVLKDLFLKCGFLLIDFKVEFGRTKSGEVVLADEISPDSCRLWDKETHEKFDKDRFRRDLGQVQEAYLEVLKRLKEVLK